MIEDIKPVWYFNWQTHVRYFRFYLGKCPGRENGIEHWTLTIGLYFIDFGRAY